MNDCSSLTLVTVLLYVVSFFVVCVSLNHPKVDVDHYRIRGGMAVETDYIIRVQPIEGDGSRGRKHKKKMTLSPTNSGLRGDSDVDCDDDDEAYDDPGDFGVFMLSKTYSAFRTLGHQLKKAADKFTSKADRLPIAVQRAAQYAETFIHLVEGQRPEYLGKVRVVQTKECMRGIHSLNACFMSHDFSMYFHRSTTITSKSWPKNEDKFSMKP
jgi:hypothetical protein